MEMAAHIPNRFGLVPFRATAQRGSRLRNRHGTVRPYLEQFSPAKDHRVAPLMPDVVTVIAGEGGLAQLVAHEDDALEDTFGRSCTVQALNDTNDLSR